MWYLDAYERVEHENSLLESPFFIGENTVEISKAQSCWNDAICGYERPQMRFSAAILWNKTAACNY